MEAAWHGRVRARQDATATVQLLCIYVSSAHSLCLQALAAKRCRCGIVSMLAKQAKTPLH